MALHNKQKLGIISLDISKAYDAAWRPRIIYKLNKILPKGNMLQFLNNFLCNRTFQVKTLNFFSDPFTQENGVPQGSTISETLFLIAINDISRGILNPNIPLLYADDFTIININTISIKIIFKNVKLILLLNIKINVYVYFMQLAVSKNNFFSINFTIN